MNIYRDSGYIVVGRVVRSTSIHIGAVDLSSVEVERSSLSVTRLRGLVKMFMNDPDLIAEGKSF